MRLVRLMRKSAFDPKWVFRRSSWLARREERLAQLLRIKSVELNWVKRWTLNMSLIDWLGSCDVRLLTRALVAGHDGNGQENFTTQTFTSTIAVHVRDKSVYISWLSSVNKSMKWPRFWYFGKREPPRLFANFLIKKAHGTDLDNGRIRRLTLNSLNEISRFLSLEIACVEIESKII